MELTDIKIYLANEERLKAYVTVVMNHCFAVRDIKVIQGDVNLFVAMPSKRGKDGTYKDIAHPLNQETRAKFENQILKAYDKEAARSATTSNLTSTQTG